MNGIKEVSLAMPKGNDWIKSKSLLSTLENVLFISPKNVEKEASQHYEKFYELIRNNNLTPETISHVEQRTLASLIFPFAGGGSRYLIKLEQCWPQVQRLIVKRFDTQMIEILCMKVSNCNTSLVPNLPSIVGNLEKTLISSKSIRLKKVHRLLKQEFGGNKGDVPWIKSIRRRSGKMHLTTFKTFEQFSKSEYQDEIADKSLFISRNNFWKYYFKNGFVKQSVLLAVPAKQSKVKAYSESTIELTGETNNEFAIMFHIGDAVFIEWANPGGYNSIKETDELLSNFSMKSIDLQEVQNTLFTKHRANAFNYWQYKAASLLKATTGVQPSRSEYKSS